MKILFLSRWFPYPASNGSKIRIYSLLRGLAKHHTVTLLSFADQPDVNPEAAEIRQICSAVHTVPWREFDPNSARARFGFLSSTPRSLIDTFSTEMAQRITELLSTGSYDLVIASQLSMASYRPYFKNIPAIFEEVEVGLSHDRIHESNLVKRLRHAFTWWKLRLYLSRLLNAFQGCTVVSKQEQELLIRNLSLRNVELAVIPNCLDVDDYGNHQAPTVQNQLIFSGSFRYHANYEAMLWYTEKVQPRVVKAIPDVCLLVTGDHGNLSLPFSQNVTLTGYVDDIKALIASSAISIAPLLSGGGTRLKILEAMALGTPVISTTKGTEGLTAENGVHLLIADEPDDFAEGIIKILEDTEFSRRLSSNAHQLVRENYDWSAVMPTFLKLVESAVTG